MKNKILNILTVISFSICLLCCSLLLPNMIEHKGNSEDGAYKITTSDSLRSYDEHAFYIYYQTSSTTVQKDTRYDLNVFLVCNDQSFGDIHDVSFYYTSNYQLDNASLQFTTYANGQTKSYLANDCENTCIYDETLGYEYYFEVGVNEIDLSKIPGETCSLVGKIATISFQITSDIIQDLVFGIDPEWKLSITNAKQITKSFADGDDIDYSGATATMTAGGGSGTVTPPDPGVIDPSTLTEHDFYIYFVNKKTAAVGVQQSVDVYLVKNDSTFGDIRNVVFYFTCNYELHNLNFVPYANGQSFSYLTTDSETELAYLDPDLGYEYYFDVGVNNIDLDKSGDGSCDMVGKIGTIYYTIQEDKGENLVFGMDPDWRLVITNDKNITKSFEDGDDIDYSLATSNITVGAASTGVSIESIKVDNQTPTLVGTDYAYTVSSYTNSTATLEVVLASGNTIKSVKVGATTINPTNGKYIIPLGNTGETTAVSVTGLSEDNTTTQTYTVNIARPKSADTSATITVKGENDNITYTKDATSTDSVYVYNVPESASRAKVTITANGYGATVTTGNTALFNIPSTGNSVTIKAQDGTTKTIIINITKAKDTDNKINDIKVQTSNVNATLIHDIGFNQSTNDYSFTVGNSVTSVYFNVTKNSSFSQVTGDGTQVLNVGQNTFKIYATSESGVKGAEYTITINREASISYNFEITSITVTGNDSVNYLTNYNKETKTYTLTVPNNVSVVTVNATVPGGSNTSVIGNSAYSLTAGVEETIVVQSVANGDASQKGEEYIIKVTRLQALANNNLTNLTVNGVQVEGFDPNKYVYNMRVDLSVSSVTIDATVDESTKAQIVSGVGSKTLIEGRNEAKVVVRAENGLTQDYVINIYKQEDKNTINNISISGYSEIATLYTFNANTLNYSFNVPYKVYSLNFEVTYDGSKGVITGAGTNSLSVGSNSIKVYVTSQYGTKGTEYTFNITRQAADTNNTLASLSVLANGKDELISGFNPNNTTYTLVLENTVTSVVINAVAQSANATVTGDKGNVSLTELFNALPNGAGVVALYINVTPEQGQTKTYTIRLSREAIDESEDNSVTGIKITNDKAVTIFESEFNQSQTTYSITVPYDINSVNVTVSRGSNVSTLYGAGTFLIDNSNKLSLNVYCVSQSGNEGTHYTINITRELADTENRLDSLKFMGESLVGFNPDITVYTKMVEYTEETVYIEAIAKSNNASIMITSNGQSIENNKDFKLNVGSNIVTISVTSQSNEIKMYTLTIVRPAAPGRLSDLKVESAVEGVSGNYALLNADGEIVLFDENVFTYYVRVPFEIDHGSKLNIVAECDRSKLNVGIFENLRSFPVDEPVTVMVTVQPTDTTSGATNSVYRLIITRERKVTDVIKINKVDIEMAVDYDPDTFDPSKTEYEGNIYVRSNVTSIDFDITFEHDQDEMAPTYKVIGGNALKFGDNTVCVEISSSSGINKVSYYFNVVRKNVELINAFIAEIPDFSVKFSNDITTYYYTVGGGVKNLDIRFDTDCESTTYRQSTTELAIGLNNISIDVYSGDEKVKTFNLIVLRQGSDGNSLSKDTIIMIVVIPVVIVIEIIIVVIVLLAIKKSKRNKLAKN